MYKRYASKNFLFSQSPTNVNEVESQRPELYLNPGSPKVSMDNPQLGVDLIDQACGSPTKTAEVANEEPLELSPENRAWLARDLHSSSRQMLDPDLPEIMQPELCGPSYNLGAIQAQNSEPALRRNGSTPPNRALTIDLFD